MKKSLSKQILTIASLIVGISSCTIRPISPMDIVKPVAAASFIGAIGYGLYKIGYQQINARIDTMIVEEIVSAIKLVAKPTALVKEQDLLKKATLLRMFLNILDTLTIASQNNKLSEAHSAALSNKIKHTAPILRALITNALDKIYTRQPELEYITPKYPFIVSVFGFNHTISAQEIEQRIVNNILLFTKPDGECTDQERAEKQAIQKRDIAGRVKQEILCDVVMHSPLGKICALGVLLTLITAKPLLS